MYCTAYHMILFEGHLKIFTGDLKCSFGVVDVTLSMSSNCYFTV